MFGKPAFGATSTASTFGTGGSLFGTPTKPTVGFANPQPTQSSSIFGQKPLFGSSTPAQPTSIFGSAQPASTVSSSLFGQSKPLFGSATTQPSGFGTSSSLFSTAQPSTQSGGLFGGSFGASTATGTTIKFEPPTATDTMLRNSTNQTINTKHMCITAMKQYEAKSLEELRCEDYVAGRKGPQASGSLTFGQAATQPSTSGLFSTQTAATQSSSLFGQNKSLFGTASTAFGAPATSTQSLFGSQPAAGSSLFGPKKTGLFGTTTTSTASPFGQTQQSTTGTGLFGAKPAAGFGTQQASLFGGTSTFGTTASTASPFTFGAATSTSTVAPFGQTQPTTTGFGFGQPAASTASTGLFGAKPATSGFGAFGTTPATSSAFGTTATTGGLFGAKPATGGLFGSTTGGSLFGSAPTSSAPSLFGAPAAKPATSFFGAPAGQTAFGTSAASVIAAAPVAPIVLGADVNQTLLQNALIEAQIASSPYGDSPLLKLVPKETSQKSDVPNPTSVERQMRFLASKTQKGANTTTVNGPSALGSIPAAGLPITMPPAYSKTRTSAGDFSYRPVFSPPALKNRNASPIVNLNNSTNRSSIMSNSARDDSVSALLEQSEGELVLHNRRSSNVKRLDLGLLHRSMQESRNRTAQQLSADSPTTHFENNAAAGEANYLNGVIRQEGVREEPPRAPQASPQQTPIRNDGDSTDVGPRHHLVEKERPAVAAGSEEISSTPVRASSVAQDVQTVSVGRTTLAADDASLQATHPSGIKLRRADYECEPSLKELTVMAARNGGICHLERGFTVRRLAYGSVFWPGPFDLSNVDLDEIIHFRQHEVTVYPEDDNKPPVGEQLNRFAEVSLERVWPVDKRTKELITDPLRIERYGFRAKLERHCLAMGAKFKDYRPETGTWVFTVPHFTKYGLPDDSDEDMPSPEQLKASVVDNRLQSAVQRARLPFSQRAQFGEAQNVPILGRTPDNKAAEQIYPGLQVPLQISEIPTPIRARGLGGVYNDGDRADEISILNFTQTTVGTNTPKTPESVRRQKRNSANRKTEREVAACLDLLIEDSMSLQVSEGEHNRSKKIELNVMEPANKLPFIGMNQSIISRYFGTKISLIDSGIYNNRRARIGWAPGTIMASSMLPQSFSVQIRQLQLSDPRLAEYLSDLIGQSISLGIRFAPQTKMDGFDGRTFVPGYAPSKDSAKMIDMLIEVSKKHGRHEGMKVWELCKALFTDPSHIDVQSSCLKDNERRECIGNWLRGATQERCRGKPAPRSESALIFYHLCNGNLKAAVKQAISSKRFLLAIALSTFQHSSRASYKKQVEYWSITGATEFVDESLLKIYLIMAGMPYVDVKGRRIFVTDGLDWMQALGLFMWYYCNAETSAGDAVTAFASNLEKEGGNLGVFQTVYFGLIKLACCSDFPMEVLLEPTAFAKDYFDCHLSWHLYRVLESLGFRSTSTTAKHALHFGYAEQLAHLNLISDAIFVLMHIEHDSSRQKSVTEMADRLAVNEDNAQWDKIAALGLPDEIVAHARFMRARFLSNFIDMCRYALEAGMYEEAHELFVKQVGPFAVANDRLDALEQFCMLFAEKSTRIGNWGPCGQIYADFYCLHEGIRGVEDDSQIAELVDLAHSLEPRLATLETTTPLERLSVAVMSRLVFEIIARFEEIKLANLPLSLDKAVDIASNAARVSVITD